MKQHTAQELEGHRLRIASPDTIPLPTGRAVTVTDLETGEEIENVASIDLHIVPQEVITARLTLYSLGQETLPGDTVHLFVREHFLTARSPDVALSAIVTQE